MNVLFVCTGNVCRSPMAEGFLKQQAVARGLELSVRSTGTHAWAGRAATIDGRRIMHELGTPIDDHRTLLFETHLVEWADLVIALAEEHVREILRTHPDTTPRTFTLKEFVNLLPHLPPLTTADDWIAQAHAIRETVPAPSDMDVDDPFGEREEAYRRVATEIQTLIEQMAEGLAAKLVRSA